MVKEVWGEMVEGCGGLYKRTDSQPGLSRCDVGDLRNAQEDQISKLN